MSNSNEFLIDQPPLPPPIEQVEVIEIEFVFDTLVNGRPYKYTLRFPNLANFVKQINTHDKGTTVFTLFPLDKPWETINFNHVLHFGQIL